MNVFLVPYFLILCSIIAFLFYFVEGKLILKLVSIVGMFYIASAIYFSFESYRGWPASETEAMDGMVLMSVVIFDKSSKAEGHIFVEGIPCLKGKCDQDIPQSPLLAELSPFKVFGYIPTVKNYPRLYEFAYTDANRKLFSEAQKNMKDGGRSIFHRNGKGNKEGNGSGRPSDAKGDKAGYGSGDGTINGHSTGAPEIYIDNQSIKDLLSKETPQ